ncbi:MAG: lipocalin-like domain-containing protein [Myxococcaceae bacterium]
MTRALIFVALLSAGCARHALQRAPEVADIQLPRDHGAHLSQTEWWHFHGHLTDKRGRQYDFFLGFVRWHTDEDRFLFFPVRFAVDPGQLAVFSVTDREAGRFHEREKYAYPDVWAASAAAGKLELRHDEWSARGSPEGMRLYASTGGAELELTLGDGKPLVREGRDGLFDVPPTPHLFYTLPRMPAAGHLTLDGERLEVSGLAWVKHEWGYLYAERLAGWVWFGVQLDSGEELQVGLLRDREWQEVEGSFAEVIDKDGVARRLDLSGVGVVQTGEVWTSPRTGVTWPIRWTLELPERRGSLVLSTTVPGQELWAFPSPIWAGSLEVKGTLDGRPVKGQAMAEIFGLEQPFLRRFYTSGAPPGGGAP